MKTAPLHAVKQPDEPWVYHVGVPDLRDLQSYCGGYIEALRCSNGITLIFNEEGKFDERMTPNLLRTVGDIPFDYIVGPIVALRYEYCSGELVGLNEADIPVLTRWADERRFNEVYDG